MTPSEFETHLRSDDSTKATDVLQEAMREGQRTVVPSVLKRMKELQPSVRGHGYVMASCVVALGELCAAGDPEAIAAILAALHEEAWWGSSDDAQLDECGLAALVRLEARGAVGDMKRWLVDDDDEEELFDRGQLATSLVALGGEEALKFLTAQLASKDSAVVAGCAEALGVARYRAAEPALRRLTSSKNVDVKAAAENALAALDPVAALRFVAEVFQTAGEPWTLGLDTTFRTALRALPLQEEASLLDVLPRASAFAATWVFEHLIGELARRKIAGLVAAASAIARDERIPLTARVRAASLAVNDAADLELAIGLADVVLEQFKGGNHALADAFEALIDSINELARRGGDCELVAVRALARWNRVESVSILAKPIARSILERTNSDRFSGIDAWIAKRAAEIGAG